MKRILLLNFLLCFALVGQVLAQDRSVTGKVTSVEDGSSLPGVNVMLKGTGKGTTTDIDGNFKLSVPNEGGTLVFSFIGLATEEVSIGTRSVINFAMKADVKQLGEVIVTGYSTVTKEDKTQSVSVISGKDIAQQPNPSVAQLLQGRSPGVQVTAENGRPGAPAFIRVRGTGSISGGNQPLLVVNGVQISDGMRDQFFSTLNTNDIESFTILKDAAAAAIYGARGSNGVIVITTKSGANSKGNISYSFQRGVNEMVPNNFQLMDAREKMQYEFETGFSNSVLNGHLRRSVANGGMGLPSTATILNVTEAQRQEAWNAVAANGQDWLDAILRTGDMQSHQISASGSSGKTNYYISFQAFDQNGITDASAFKRYTGNATIETEVKPWLSISNTTQLGHSGTNEVRDRNNAQSPFGAMYRYNAYEPVFNPDGTYNYTHQGFPILEALKNNIENRQNLVGLNAFTVTVRPMKGMTLSSKLATSLDDYKRESYVKPGSVLDTYVGDPNNPGIKTDNGSREFNYSFINQARYNFKIAEQHNFNFGVIQEFQKNQFSSYSFTKKGFASGDIATQNAGAANDGNNTSFRSAWVISSVAATAGYNYAGRYFATGSIRRDGSSRFGRSNQWGNFWSSSLGWLASNEQFLQDISWISLVKVRGSVGTLGSFAGLGNYGHLGLYGFNRYNNQIASWPTQVENATLGWEKRLKKNVGVDFEVLQSRFALTIDAYDELTTDLLLNVPLSRTSGFTSITDNVGSMRNRGIEISAQGDIIRAGDFVWSVNGNITFNRNKVVSLNEGQEEIMQGGGIGVFKPGLPQGTFKLVRWAGVNPETGAAQFYTKDGEITTAWDPANAVVLEGKDPNPDFFGGFGTTLSYKGLDFGSQFNFVSGIHTLNYNYWQLNRWPGDPTARQSQQAVGANDYWKQPGDQTFLPRYVAGQVTRVTDQYLQKASFLRLRNVTVGYTLPQNLTEKVKVQSLRVYVQGQNLLTYNPHFFGDPEIGTGNLESFNNGVPGSAALFGYPTTRQFNFGVDITF
jgi:TonB-linked SusC/RagA family outer membrane protein